MTGPRKAFTSGDKSTLVELGGDGSQTMIPPSVHPNGIKLEFTSFNEEVNPIDQRHHDEMLSPFAGVSFF